MTLHGQAAYPRQDARRALSAQRVGGWAPASWRGIRAVREGKLRSRTSSKADIIKSMMESVVYDLRHTLALLDERGLKPKALNGTGGGIRSEWWTQLKADLIDVPV